MSKIKNGWVRPVWRSVTLTGSAVKGLSSFHERTRSISATSTHGFDQPRKYRVYNMLRQICKSAQFERCAVLFWLGLGL